MGWRTARRHRAWALASLALLAASPVEAASCDKPVTQADLTACQAETLQTADAALNATLACARKSASC